MNPEMKLIGCTDAKTYASMCNICSYAQKGNECEHSDKIKLYEGEETAGYKLIGCQDGKEFFMCENCSCEPGSVECRTIQERKVYMVE